MPNPGRSMVPLVSSVLHSLVAKERKAENPQLVLPLEVSDDDTLVDSNFEKRKMKPYYSESEGTNQQTRVSLKEGDFYPRLLRIQDIRYCIENRHPKTELRTYSVGSDENVFHIVI